jgi:hypothetical protein
MGLPPAAAGAASVNHVFVARHLRLALLISSRVCACTAYPLHFCMMVNTTRNTIVSTACSHPSAVVDQSVRTVVVFAATAQCSMSASTSCGPGVRPRFRLDSGSHLWRKAPVLRGSLFEVPARPLTNLCSRLGCYWGDLCKRRAMRSLRILVCSGAAGAAV